MRVDDLQIFIAVAELQSFQAAEPRVFLSQSAISKRIASLEQRLGQKLFNRLGKTIELTEAGQAYLPHARQTLASLADGQRALDNLATGVAGRLELAVSHHIGLHRLPPVLRRYVQAYPRVQPRIEFDDSEQACQRVINGEAELGLITLPDTPHDNLITQCIWPDPLAIYADASHPLAQSTQVSLAELTTYPAVLPPVGSYTLHIIQTALAHHGLDIQAHMSTHSLDTLYMLADVGLGWTVLPRAMQPHLAALAVPPLPMQRELGVIRHPQRHLSNAAQALLAMLQDEMTTHASPCY